MKKSDIEDFLPSGDNYGKMNRYWKRKWVEALTSGEYKQCTGLLHANGGYCCLGVLADISTEFDWVKEPGQPWYAVTPSSCVTTDFAGNFSVGYDTLLPLETSLITGLGQNETEVLHLLADANDGGVKFREIAKWIEENL